MSGADVAGIAAGLNPLSRQDLIDLCNGIHRPSLDVFCLILMGLADYRRRYWLFGPKVVVPTKLGLAVRAHLQENPHETQSN